MKFMILIKSDANAESGVLPPPAVFEAMGKFNQELIDAGLMLAAEGLAPSSKGARVHFSHGQVRVVDGPFTETKELIAGFWIWQVKSKEEAIEWAKRMPTDGRPFELEIRPVHEAADFEPIDPTGELRQKEQDLRAKLGRKS